MTQRTRDKIIDHAIGAFMGTLVTGSLLVFAVYRKVDLIDARLGNVEQTLKQITRVELVQPTTVRARQ